MIHVCIAYVVRITHSKTHLRNVHQPTNQVMFIVEEPDRGAKEEAVDNVKEDGGHATYDGSISCAKVCAIVKVRACVRACVHGVRTRKDCPNTNRSLAGWPAVNTNPTTPRQRGVFALAKTDGIEGATQLAPGWMDGWMDGWMRGLVGCWCNE